MRSERILTEHTELLLWQLVFGYSIVIVKSGLRSPTDVHSACNVSVGPFKHLRYLIPIAHVFKFQMFYRRTGYNHSVKLLVLQYIKIFVEHHHVLYWCIFGSVALQFHEVYFHLQRSVGKQAHEIGLGRYLQRHEIENHNAKRSYILTRSS